MATSRPGFARTNTERHEGDQGIELQSGGGFGKKDGSYELRDRDAKDGAGFDVKPIEDDAPPEYEDAGDGFMKVSGWVDAMCWHETWY